MNSCQSCLHYSECMEQRGICREYKDLKGVIEDIEMLNQKAKPSASSEADTALARQDRDGDRTPSRSENGEPARCAGSKEEAPDTF